MTDFAELREAATPERQTARVCLDREARTGLLDVLEQIGSLSNPRLLDGPDEYEALAEKAKELDAQVQASTKTLTFAKVPRRLWRELEEAHPATEVQRKANPKQTLDPDGFEIAVAAATAVDPEMSVEDAEWLRDLLPDSEWNEVVGAVLAANQAGGQVPKGVTGIADRLITELKSITPPPTGSPSPSSEDES